MIQEERYQKLVALAEAATEANVGVVVQGSVLLDILSEVQHGDRWAPNAGSPRPDENGFPCWCNGPYAQEEHHHPWCRNLRNAWRYFLAARERYAARDETFLSVVAPAEVEA